MAKHFTHLHVHTDYSLLDGAISIKKLVDFGKKNNLNALAITDHGNLFGAVKFFQECTRAGIKPIIGIEAYLTEDIQIRDASNKYYHLIILAQNEQGYKNLCKLNAYAYTDGFYFKPRIDYRLLKEHSQGLIVTTACLGGHIPTLLMQEQDKQANKWLDWYLQVFGPERFYLEVQPEDQKEQQQLNERLWDLSKKKGIGVVATADCHYTTAEDREAHEVMLAIQTHHKITDPGRFTFGDCRVHLRTPTEMFSTFTPHEEAIWNSGLIADRCNFEFQTGKLYFPQFDIPKTHTQESYFQSICTEGLTNLINAKRIDESKLALYQARLVEEIELITKMGFIGYFLVVSDFIKWAKRNDIPVGPGRGSAAGSLVAWCLEITDIDPIKYNLLFERFLNPERITMPDIDIDFCIEGRDQVINYMKDKYGHDKVCQIITFGTMMAKGVIKDVARALGFPFEDSNALTDLIPDQLKITLHEAIEAEPRLKKLIDSNPQVAKLFDIAFRLEGLTRHASKHAAGLVISPEAVTEMLPVYVPPRSNDLVTQYAMTELEYLGFLKMDFLGLKNLTLIKRALALIEKNHGTSIDINHLPLNDTKTLTLLASGDTSGVFQLESEGIKDVLRRLIPGSFEDIIAVNALYRPGPLGSGMVDDFIERKHGRQSISYLFDELEPILKETYGVIVYQEQVMKIASTIGGYSLGEADILRRAMGKKKIDVMEKQKAIFIERATTQGFDAKKAEELFDLMAYFAGYGFNKSHSAAYALIAYQTAYLKAHYPAEFMACLISLEVSNPEHMADYLSQAKSKNIPILPPDLNASHREFDVVDGAIRFGLRGIRNLGAAALDAIIQERTNKGAFKDLFDFSMRIDLRTCNKRVLESLISSGACDNLPGNRAQQHEELNIIVDQAIEKKKELETGQMGLFNVNTKDNTDIPIYSFTPRDDWDDRTKLEKEKDVLGVYLSAQPLDRYQKYLNWMRVNTFKGSYALDTNITCCGFVKSIRQITTKKGDPMAFMQCEDYTGRAEIVIFPKLYARISQWLDTHSIFVITGNTDQSNGETCKIKAQNIIPMDVMLAEGTGIQELTVELPEQYDTSFLTKLKEQAKPGLSQLSFVLNDNRKRVKITTRKTITCTTDIYDTIEAHKANIVLKL